MIILWWTDSAVIQRILPPKYKDPGSVTILCSIGVVSVGKALIDLGANINLICGDVDIYDGIDLR